MLAHNIRGRYWWFGSRGWTFPPISHYILFIMWQMAAEGWSEKNYVWCGNVYEANVCDWILPCRNNGTHWHSSMPSVCYGDQTVDVEHSEAVVVSFSSGDSVSPPLVQMFMNAACRLLFLTGKNAQLKMVTIVKQVFCSWEFALSNRVIALFVSVLFSMEINRWHCFWSNLHICGPREFLFTKWSLGKIKGWIPMV